MPENLKKEKKIAKKSTKSAKTKTKQVRFDLFAPEAQNISLAGDFNGWDISSLPMEKDNQGNWKISVNLDPGRHEYRFYVDGIWQDDPKAGGCASFESSERSLTRCSRDSAISIMTETLRSLLR